jgi:predicted site-specific integrase-resolvase
MDKEESRNNTINTKEAAAIIGMTPRSLQNYITKGKLSAKRDDSGNYQIDKAEFYRVFPDAHKEKRHEKITGTSQELLEAEVKHLKEMNGFLHKQLEAANVEKAIILDTLSSNMKLLEHGSKKMKRRRFLGIF